MESVRTLDDLRAEALAAPRLTATLLGIFAGLALLMTLAGIGGVIATSVTARTREFGVRMALGAGRETVLAMVVRQGVTLVAIGLAIGLAGALALSRVLSAYLIKPRRTIRSCSSSWRRHFSRPARSRASARHGGPQW